MNRFLSKFRSTSDRESTAFLIVGLGNPGREYRQNRHNIGFMLVDRLASDLGEAFSRFESRALVTKTKYKDFRIILAKPQTYMNKSGQAVGSLYRYYKISINRLLVVYDDVDLPFGKLRMRPAGRSGGHRGMKSVIESLGTDAFPRLRIGIGRPPGRMDAADHVLRDFSKEESERLSEVLDGGVDAVLKYIIDGIDKAMNQYNSMIVDE